MCVWECKDCYIEDEDVFPTVSLIVCEIEVDKRYSRSTKKQIRLIEVWLCATHPYKWLFKCQSINNCVMMMRHWKDIESLQLNHCTIAERCIYPVEHDDDDDDDIMSSKSTNKHNITWSNCFIMMYPQFLFFFYKQIGKNKMANVWWHQRWIEC